MLEIADISTKGIVMWILYALLSALFASLITIFAKADIKGAFPNQGRSSGAGFGLAISRQICEASGVLDCL